jgi:hypothetical protein
MRVLRLVPAPYRWAALLKSKACLKSKTASLLAER